MSEMRDAGSPTAAGGVSASTTARSVPIPNVPMPMIPRVIKPAREPPNARTRRGTTTVAEPRPLVARQREMIGFCTSFLRRVAAALPSFASRGRNEYAATHLTEQAAARDDLG